MVLTPEFPLPKCSAAGSAATQLSGIRNHPPQLFRVEILDHSSALLQTFLCGGAPRGCAVSHSSYSQVARSPPKPCEAHNKSEDCQILAGNYDLSPISCIDFMLSIPLSSASVHMAGLWGNYHRQGKKKEKALSLPLPPTCPLCHKLPEHRANA